VTKRVKVDISHIDLDVDLLLLDSPGFPINEAGDFDAEICLDAGLLDGVLVKQGGIRDMESIINHRGGAFTAGFEDGLGAFLVVM